MTLPSHLPSFQTPAVQPATSRSAPQAASLSKAEEATIADAFPARPQIAQKLYGPGRGVHQPAQVGGRLDLSA